MSMKLLIPLALLGASTISSAVLAAPAGANGPDHQRAMHAHHKGHVVQHRDDDGPHNRPTPWLLPQGWPAG